MNQVRTLMVDLSTRFGGTDARVLGLLQALPHGAAALACLRGSPVGQQAEAAGIEILWVSRSKADFRLAWRIARAVRQGGFSVIDAQNPQSQWWSSLAARFSRAALVSTLNSWYLAEHQGRWKGRVYQSLERLNSSRVDRYVAVSSDIQQQLLAQGIEDERISLIRNAAPMNLGPSPISGLALRQQYGFPDHSVVACAVGRLVPVKGFADLIAALAQLGDSTPPVCCLIVGDGELRFELADSIVRHRLHERVRLTGLLPQRQVFETVQAADWFIMPSLSEGTPLALLEAGAMGKPVVASRVGGIPEILTDEVHGLLSEPGNVDSLCQALRRMLSSPQDAALLGSRLQRHVAEQYSMETLAAATQQAWRSALERRQRRNGKAARSVLDRNEPRI